MCRRRRCQYDSGRCRPANSAHLASFPYRSNIDLWCAQCERLVAESQPSAAHNSVKTIVRRLSQDLRVPRSIENYHLSIEHVLNKAVVSAQYQRGRENPFLAGFCATSHNCRKLTDFHSALDLAE